MANSISWADLFILVGNVALESMGFKTLVLEAVEKIFGSQKKIFIGDQKKNGLVLIVIAGNVILKIL